MKEYFAPSWVSGNVWKILRMAFILITLWPLYIRTDASPQSLLLTALVLIAVKLLSSYGLWRRLQCCRVLQQPATSCCAGRLAD